MSFRNSDVHHWAQEALDKYNGGYTASVVNLNATTYLYELRDNGNSEIALAVASHYLHCRYITSQYYLPGAIIGTVAAAGYDGVWKLIEKSLEPRALSSVWKVSCQQIQSNDARVGHARLVGRPK